MIEGGEAIKICTRVEYIILKFNKTGTKFNITSKQAAKIFFKLCNNEVMESILNGDVHLVGDVESIEE